MTEPEKENAMARSISIAILAGGILMVIFGISAARSLSSDFSNLFTGFPTEKSMWMLIGGAVLCAVGFLRLGQRVK